MGLIPIAGTTMPQGSLWHSIAKQFSKPYIDLMEALADGNLAPNSRTVYKLAMFSTIYHWNCQLPMLTDDLFCLQVGVVRRAHHWRAGDLLKAQGLSDLAVFVEFGGGDISFNREVGFAGLQVLP